MRFGLPFIPLYSLSHFPANLPVDSGVMEVERSDVEMKKAKLYCLHMGTGLQRVHPSFLRAQQPWIVSRLLQFPDSRRMPEKYKGKMLVLPEGLQQIKPGEWEELKCGG